MADYDALDEATLQKMVDEADSYEERSAIRQALRRKKKDRGERVGHAKARGVSGYNRFAGSTAPSKLAPAPKNFVQDVPAASESKPQLKPVKPATPTKQQSPVPRPRSPSPPPAEKPCEEEPSKQDEPPVSQSPEHETEGGEEGETDGTPVAALPEEEDKLCPSSPANEEEQEPDVPIREEDGHKEEVDSGPSFHSTKETSTHPKVAAERGEQEDMSTSDIHKYLVAYVNTELSLKPAIPVKGSVLFDVCSNPTNLCKLINKSVPNTVDLRALTIISASISEDQKQEALSDNMTLAIESARAIGCRINEDSRDKLLAKDPQTIRDFIIDLIRAKAVHLPGMEDEPSTAFTNMASLFKILNIDVDDDDLVDSSVNWRDDREKVRKALESPPPTKSSWRETSPPTKDTAALSYEERAALRKAQREKAKAQEEPSDRGELSYEERAAIRRAERDKRKREREALAK